MLSGVFVIFQALQVSVEILAEQGKWIVLMGIFAWFAGWELWKIVNQSEEYKWSL